MLPLFSPSICLLCRLLTGLQRHITFRSVVHPWFTVKFTEIWCLKGALGWGHSVRQYRWGKWSFSITLWTTMHYPCYKLFFSLLYICQGFDITVAYADVSGDVRTHTINSRDLSSSWVWDNPCNGKHSTEKTKVVLSWHIFQWISHFEKLERHNRHAKRKKEA